MQIEINTNLEQSQSIQILNEEIDRLSYENKNYLDELKTIRGQYIDYNTLFAAYQQRILTLMLVSLELDNVRNCVKEKDRMLNDYK